jgi:hypothetical protein
MLADKYLPFYHYRIFHEITVTNLPADLHKIINTKVDDWLISLLFHLRGIRLSNHQMDPGSMGFRYLEETEGKEIAYGIVSSSSCFGSCLEKFTPAGFTEKYNEGYLRGMIVFGINDAGEEKKLFTETRVHCGSKKILNRFRVYWFFVKPFSSLIRRRMLKQIRKSIH